MHVETLTEEKPRVNCNNAGPNETLTVTQHNTAKSNTSIVISLFRNKRDNKPTEVSLTWDQFLRTIKINNPPVRETKDGYLFSPATFDPKERKKEYVKHISALVLDY